MRSFTSHYRRLVRIASRVEFQRLTSLSNIKSNFPPSRFSVASTCMSVVARIAASDCKVGMSCKRPTPWALRPCSWERRLTRRWRGSTSRWGWLTARSPSCLSFSSGSRSIAARRFARSSAPLLAVAQTTTRFGNRSEVLRESHPMKRVGGSVVRMPGCTSLWEFERRSSRSLNRAASMSRRAR